MASRHLVWIVSMEFVFGLRLLIMGVTVQASLCDVYHDATYGGILMNCENLNLTEVPRNIPENTTTLILQRNKINKLHPKAFVGLTNLKRLLLSSNRLLYNYDSFPEDVFVPLRSLEVLDLTGNIIDKPSPYPDMAFSHLVSLRELHLDTFDNITLGRGFAKLLKLKIMNFFGLNCKLSKLMNNTFYYLQNSSLAVLDLENCPIRHIDNGTFLPLKFLSVLNMKWIKYLSIKDAMASLYGLQGRNMSLIDFTRVFNPGTYSFEEYGRNSKITKVITKYLTNICVKKLSISHNQIYYLEVAALRGVPFSQCIEELDISKNIIRGNYIYYLNWRMFPRLKRLDFSDQRLSVVDTVNSPSPSSSPVIYLELPPQLQYLNMGAVIHKVHMPDVQFTNGNNLQYLNLSFDGISDFTFHLIGLPNLTSLDISKNNAMPFAVDFLHAFRKLVNLSMSNMNFDVQFFYHNARTIFSKCTALESINLAYNKFSALPPDLFKDLTNLRFVDLSNNNLVSLTVFLSMVPNLQKLDFSYNSLTFITADDLKIIESSVSGRNFSFALRGNPITCTCNSLAFISWLFITSESKFDNGRNYICTGTDGNLTTTLAVHQNYHRYWVSCISPTLFTLALTLLCLIIIVFLCSFVVVNNWTRIHHKLLRLLGSPYRLPQRRDFPFAIYVGYCDSDYMFVYRTIYQSLEVLGGLRLYLQEREILPGHGITEGIIEGINTSWKTLLIVTRDFIQDPCSFLKIRTCVFAVSEATPRRVILLIVGDVCAADIPGEILTVVHEHDILTIPSTEASEDALAMITDMVTNDSH